MSPTATETSTLPRLKQRYREEIVPALRGQFDFANVMQVPTVTKVVVNMGVGDAARDADALREAQPLFPLEDGTDRPPVQAAIALSPGRPDRGALGAVEHAELDPRQVGRPTHDTPQRIHLPHHGPLGNPADRRIARPLPATIEAVGWELFRLMLDVASGRKKTWAEHWQLHNALVLFNPAPVT